MSSPVLTFPDAGAGQPRFQVLTLAQHHTDTPVTLTTDAPDYFQLASDARPQFASSLTLTPPPEGTHVHVRYLAANSGQHVGQLLIQSPYDTQAVTLHARTGSLLSQLRPNSSFRSLQPVSRRGFLARHRAGLLAGLLLSGLALVGYTNRCRLAPGLCDETTAVVIPAAVPDVRPKIVPATPAAPAAVVKSAKKKTKPRRTFRPRRPVEAAGETPETSSGQTRLSGSLSGSEEAGRLRAADPSRGPRVEERRTPSRSRRRRAPEATPTEISELERELNRTPND